MRCVAAFLAVLVAFSLAVPVDAASCSRYGAATAWVEVCDTDGDGRPDRAAYSLPGVYGSGGLHSQAVPNGTLYWTIAGGLTAPPFASYATHYSFVTCLDIGNDSDCQEVGIYGKVATSNGGHLEPWLRVYEDERCAYLRAQVPIQGFWVVYDSCRPIRRLPDP